MMFGLCEYVVEMYCDHLYVTANSVCRVFFFFKQKTAYEMRISDWSSDVCSSDLEHSSQNGDNRDDHEQLDQSEGASLRHRARPNEIGRASCRERVCQYV